MDVKMADNPSTGPDQGLSQIVESPQAERLATGFQFTEGPLWHPDGYLLFVDIRRSLIFRLVPGGKPEVIRENSGSANGLTFDLKGRLIMCEGDNRRVTCWEEDGKIKPIAQRWQGKRLHRPNDVVCRSDGSIYFTNPGGRLDPTEREIPFSGVHRVGPNGRVSAVVRDMESPNGLAFSPDERILYVANTRQAMYISAYDVKPDGSVTNGRIFADMSSSEPDGVPDGMKVDVAGRVYCTGPGGCWVFAPSGDHLGIIRLPEIPANCAWGGPDYQTMFFTARTSVYSMRMKTPGTRVNGADQARLRKLTAEVLAG
jgi:gluconolactonase